jgi:DNA modification methylase
MIESLIHGECLEKLKDVEDKTVDLILTDLPFQTTQNKWDIIIPFEPLWEQYGRIIKDNGAIVLNSMQPFTSQLICSKLEWFKYELIWQKNKPRGFLNAKKQPLRTHESIVVFYKNQPTYNPQKTTGHKPVNSYTKHTSDGSNYGKTKTDISGGGSTERYPTSILNFPVVNNDSEEKYHPTQKPVELCEYLIKTFTNEGDLVLDSCMGSGTSCLAAKRLKRQYVGIEKDAEYYKIATERLQKG